MNGILKFHPKDNKMNKNKCLPVAPRTPVKWFIGRLFIGEQYDNRSYENYENFPQMVAV